MCRHSDSQADAGHALRLGVLALALMAVGCTENSTRHSIDLGPPHPPADATGGSVGSGDAAADVRPVRLPDAQVPQPEGCVDIWADERTFEGGSKFFVYDGVWAQTKYHVNAYGVHFAARLVERGPSGRTYTGPGQRGELGVATFDPYTGRVRLARRLDVFGPGSEDNNGGDVKGFATAPDGTFAVLFAQQHPVTAVPTWMLVMGRVDGGDTSLVPLPWRQDGYPQDLAWDGETYVAHGVGLGDSFWGMTRIRTDGTIVAGVEPLVGNKLDVREDTNTYVTDPVSGRTYYADFDGSSILCIHERDGRTTPALPEGCREIDSYFPTAPSPDDGLAVADATPWIWGMINDPPSAHGLETLRYVLRSIEEPMPTAGRQIIGPNLTAESVGGFRELLFVMGLAGPTTWARLGVVYRSALGFGLMDAEKTGRRWAFLTDRRNMCAALHSDTEECRRIDQNDRFGPGAYWDATPVVHTYDREAWFGIGDNVKQPSRFPDYGTGIVYHIMKLVPGCRYLSVAQSIEDGLGRPESR